MELSTAHSRLCRHTQRIISSKLWLHLPRFLCFFASWPGNSSSSFFSAQARSDPQTCGPTAHLPSHGNAPGRPDVLQPEREGSFTHLQQPSTPPSIRAHPRCPERLCLIRV
uniref:Uncharacterized protein n=1 Tax=Mustela putorius furo TaxID=9669 RepID=M3YXJ7_MUSPF